jgi:hypothetical protein
MKKIITCTFIAFSLMGCSDASRTVPVLVMDERTISGDVPRDPLVIPPDYRNPKLNPPREDTVLRDYQKNNIPRNWISSASAFKRKGDPKRYLGKVPKNSQHLFG